MRHTPDREYQLLDVRSGSPVDLDQLDAAFQFAIEK